MTLFAGADRTIAVGFDGAACSDAALEWAAGLASLTGATVVAVTAWEWPTSYGVALFLPSEYDPAVDAERMLLAALTAVQARHPDVAFEPLVVEGHPAPVLVDASRDADLLVVGSRGHGEFTGMLIGSVGEHCATNAHCPVLIVRGRD